MAVPDRAGAIEKIVGIELLRFVSALAVLIWHYQHFGYSAGAIDVVRQEQPFYRLLFPFYERGWLGVQMFWCISGFIFFARYYAALAAGNASFSAFAVNRFSRLYPLHVLTLLLVAGLQKLYLARHGEFFVYPCNDARHFLLNLFFVSGWGFESGYSFNAPIWSVSIELIVYALFFWLVSKLPVAAAYVAAIALVAVFSGIGADLVTLCLMYFFIGGLIAIGRFFPDAVKVGGIRLPLTFPAVGGLLALSVAAITVGHFAGIGGLTSTSILRPIVIAGLLFAFAGANRLFLPLAPVLTFLGNLTYASYLCHFPIQLLIVLGLPLLGWPVDYRSPLLLSGFLLATFTVAAVVYRTIEVPAQRAIRRTLLH